MINRFSMRKRVVSRLEKYVFDRVWNEPYSEYRTNTRPRILNRTSEASLGVDPSGKEIVGDVYQPVAGVLTGKFEQVSLPTTDPCYVYEIELEQFRPIKVNAPEWISLANYCNLNHVDLRLYSDSGVVLWRGGIYIKQDKSATSVLVAVDATMLHRCLDTYNADGEVEKLADPSAVYFTKYVDTDLIDVTLKNKQGEEIISYRKLAPADNEIECLKIGAKEISDIRQGGIDPVRADRTVAFYNGHVVSGDHKKYFQRGGYVESVVDRDALYDGVIDLATSKAPIYSVDGKKRVLIHIPKAKNPENYLISYNTCDFYLIPQSLTETKIAEGYDLTNAGVVFHMCGREPQFHQLTHNDFSIDLETLDQVARDAGFGGVEAHAYYLHFVVRSMSKKRGLVRDANYCDLLYSYKHTDQDIVDFLIGADSKFGDPERPSSKMIFWKAARLETGSYYAAAMMARVGSTIKPKGSDQLEVYLRPTTDKFYLPGKTYYTVSPEGNYIPKEKQIGDQIPEGVMEYAFANLNKATVTTGTPGQSIVSIEKELDHDLQEEMTQNGIRITKENQCMYCTMSTDCPRYLKSGAFTDQVCPDFHHRWYSDYIRIFGYYHTLSLICKRVTTYRVLESNRTSVEGLELTGNKITEPVRDRDGKIVHDETGAELHWLHPLPVGDPDQDLLNESIPIVSDKSMDFPVHVPLALYDLEHVEWYPMVYVNGVKVDDEHVEITHEQFSGVPDGLEEIHWTYTPSFDEDLMWEYDQRMLVVTLKEGSPVLQNGDYVTIELIPKPKGEDAIATATCGFDLVELNDDLPNGKMAFEPLGSTLKMSDGSSLKLKNSELLFLNGKQLVTGIDYIEFKNYEDPTTFVPTIQNVSYLSESNNFVEAVLSTDNMIGSAKGFVLGNKIEWDGVSPFWFDNLSVLTVAGKVISNFMYQYSGLYLEDGTHENGEPYMVRTNVPQSVLDLMGYNTGTTDNFAEQDLDKMRRLRDYFDSLENAHPYRALIPYSHKVYSTFMLAVLKDLIDGKIDFEILDEHGKPLSREAFRAQSVFSAYASLQEHDVVYKTLTSSDMKFVDVYPIYHNLRVNDRLLKKKIAYFMGMMMPDDPIRHREHVNDK